MYGGMKKKKIIIFHRNCFIFSLRFKCNNTIKCRNAFFLQVSSAGLGMYDPGPIALDLVRQVMMNFIIQYSKGESTHKVCNAYSLYYMAFIILV